MKYKVPRNSDGGEFPKGRRAWAQIHNDGGHPLILVWKIKLSSNSGWNEVDILACNKETSGCKPSKDKECFCYSQLNPPGLAQCLIQRDHTINTYLIQSMVSEMWTVSPCPSESCLSCEVTLQVNIVVTASEIHIQGTDKPVCTEDVTTSGWVSLNELVFYLVTPSSLDCMHTTAM